MSFHYTEFMGMPASGKSYSCKKYSKTFDESDLVVRKKFFENQFFIKKYLLGIYLSLRYGLFFLVIVVRYFGFGSLRYTITRRGYIDYIVIKQYLSYSNNNVIYDQGICNLAMSIGWRTNTTPMRAWKFINTLLPKNAHIFYVRSTVELSIERHTLRQKKISYLDEYTECDKINHFKNIANYLDYFATELKSSKKYTLEVLL